MTKLKRLQGTDGIRGRISTEELLDSKPPLRVFLEDGFLTPSFFELYAYSYGELIQQESNIDQGSPIIVGWDSRDKSGIFNQAAVRGLLKAGLNVYGVGVLPTPAIPLYMLKKEAAGSVVLTASHNPSDQNGIKIFHGGTAMKFLPADDTALTNQIFKNRDLRLKDIEQTGQFSDHSALARDFFIKYHQNALNSWFGQESFDDTILVVDASKGATATVAREIFSNYSFNGLFFTNMSGEINEYCGVADIEGVEMIPKEEVTGKGARFEEYQALTTIYNIARDNQDVESGKIKLTALVFDGDGDRCFRLDYDPESRGLIVSSGDYLGIHQARYLIHQMADTDSPPWFVNTVESDLNTGITAEDLGFKAVLTGVGDKWILLTAVIDSIRQQLNETRAPDLELAGIISDPTKKSEWSGIRISELWRQIQKTGDLSSHPKAGQFSLGIEESGHCITGGFLNDSGEGTRSFAGNGIKAGLNSLVACREVFRMSSQSDWYTFLKHPFAQGVKETFYVYYVDKDKLLPGTAYREELESVLLSEINVMLPDGYRTEGTFFPEEESMVFFRILKGEKTSGAVFVRNSGTEDKSALYLRGETKIAEVLATIGKVIHLHLLKTLKVRESEFAQFERLVLETIALGGNLEAVQEGNSSLPVTRVMKEIEFKEQLIYRKHGVLRLTDTGKSFIA